jgi:mono/diheme cytochrome c family protein
MRWFVLWSVLCCGLAGLLAPSYSDATCVARQRVVAVAPTVTVVKKVVAVQEVIPVAVYNPVTLLYGASYQPYAVPTATYGSGVAGAGYGTGMTSTTQPTSGLTDTQAIILLLQRMDARLTVLEQRTGIKAEPLPKAPTPEKASGKDGLSILQNRCSRCHTEGSLNAKTTFAIFNKAGSLNKLAAPQWLKISTRTALAEMPPPMKNERGEEVASMPDEENTELHRFIALQK